MAEIQQPENSEGSQAQPNPTPASGDIGIGGNVGGNFTAGNNNVVNNSVVNNYYQQEVKKNIEKHEPDFWALKHPYPMPPNFTGRITERATLTHWLKEDTENHLFILRALGGFGKSALTWHWLTHDVDIKEYLVTRDNLQIILSAQGGADVQLQKGLFEKKKKKPA